MGTTDLMMDIHITDAVLIGRLGQPNEWVLRREVTHDDGTVEHNVHSFPEDTFEWRVAEYGLDPDDRDLLLDVVMYETHLNDGIDHTHPRHLHNTTTEDARAFYLQRISRRKGKGRITSARRPTNAVAVSKPNHTQVIMVDSAGHDDAPLDAIKRHITIDPDIVAVKRAHVESVRQQQSATREPDRAAFESRPSADVLARHLSL